MSKNQHTIKSLTEKYKKEDEMKESDLLKKALFKRARGFVLEEVCEEYGKDKDKGLKLLKRKVLTKEIPPDIGAIKVLIEMTNFSDDKYKDMTDEELKLEKERLIDLLKGEEKEKNDKGN